MSRFPDGITESERYLYTAAYKRCMELIKQRNNDITVEEAVNVIVSQWGAVVGNGGLLQSFLMDEVKVPIDPVPMICDEPVRDKKWFTKKKAAGSDLEYWRRYYDYLVRKPSWTLDAVTDIDNSTDAVLNALADPSANLKQSIRGLAFGYVQSGKTSHYIGVLNKAADAGYKIIIILAGIHNNLRSQTQIRIEEEFLGYDVQGISEDEQENTENEIGVGVGHPVSVHLQALTSRDEKGDFNKIKAGTSMNPPFVLVTKKNASVLDILIKYLSDMPINNLDEKGKKKIPASYPLLLIDDEADQASLNTKDCYNSDGTLKDDFNPTRINGCIRRMLDLFECNSYVGYTATPFANIFIPPKAKIDKFGDDLFPKDFIVNIPRPEGYIGALEFFGLKEGDDEVKSMPLFREIDAGKSFCAKGTKKDDVVGELPDELKKAIKSFLITVSIRNLRGYRNKPNSMLIHVIRFKGQQNIIKRKVSKYYEEELCNYIKNGDVEIEKEIQNIWEEDYVATTKQMLSIFGRYVVGADDFSWGEVWNEIVRVVKAREIDIYSINGDSNDVLIYENHKDEPFNVIVIGGDKLARGLTLEGLSVSYFTRSSNTYDTLMQMGRWFGYRPGYLDLCRLYTTKELHGYFVDISRATEDLVRQIHTMSEVVGQTPMQFGLGVESNPDLLITSRNKMRTGKDMKRDFSAHLSQTRILDIDHNQFDENYMAVENLIISIGKPAENDDFVNRRIKRVGKHFYWFDVMGIHVAQFLENYKTSRSATRANSQYMADYISNQNTVGGVTEWTVCLINESPVGKKPFSLPGIGEVGAGIRREKLSYTDGDGICDIHAITSNGHEYLDYDEDQRNTVDQLKEAGKKAEEIRVKTRDRSKGLLILYPIGDVGPLTKEKEEYNSKPPFGFAIVFPDRQGKGDIKSYHVNDIAVEMKSNDFDA